MTSTSGALTVVLGMVEGHGGMFSWFSSVASEVSGTKPASLIPVAGSTGVLFEVDNAITFG